MSKHKNTTHGFTVNGEHHRFYRIWEAMKRRCNNKNTDN